MKLEIYWGYTTMHGQPVIKKVMQVKLFNYFSTLAVLNKWWIGKN